MRKAEIRELMRELRKWFIKAEVDYSGRYYRVKLTGGERHAREHYEQLLEADADIEAKLLIELSKRDGDLRYAIEERASIDCGCNWEEYDEMTAAKELIGRDGREEE